MKTLQFSRKSNWVLGCAFVALIARGGSAQAQSAVAEDKADAIQSAVTSDEIIATAQRRQKSTLNTPIAISALGDKDLQERGINVVADFTRQIPALVVGDVNGSLKNETNIAIKSGVSASPSVGLLTSYKIPRTYGLSVGMAAKTRSTLGLLVRAVARNLGEQWG